MSFLFLFFVLCDFNNGNEFLTTLIPKKKNKQNLVFINNIWRNPFFSNKSQWIIEMIIFIFNKSKKINIVEMQIFWRFPSVIKLFIWWISLKDLQMKYLSILTPTFLLIIHLTRSKYLTILHFDLFSFDVRHENVSQGNILVNLHLFINNCWKLSCYFSSLSRKISS